MTLAHRVGIHKPAHHTRSGADIGRRDVPFGTEQVHHVGYVATCQTFQFTLGQLVRIADDTALAATEGDIHNCAFESHPRRQRLHFVQGNVRVITNASLGRTTGDRMLDPVGNE